MFIIPFLFDRVFCYDSITKYFTISVQFKMDLKMIEFGFLIENVFPVMIDFFIGEFWVFEGNCRFIKKSFLSAII